MFKYFRLKSMIKQLRREADDMYQVRITTFKVKLCGFVPEVEEKLHRRFPKTYIEYEEAKQEWFKAYDRTSRDVELYLNRRTLDKLVYRVKNLEIERKMLDDTIKEGHEEIAYYKRLIKDLEESSI